MRIGQQANIEVLDESVSITELLKSLDFVGSGVTASEAAEGVVTVTIAGAGSGTGYTGIVEFPADLPAAADHNAELWYVYDTRGVKEAVHIEAMGQSGKDRGTMLDSFLIPNT